MAVWAVAFACVIAFMGLGLVDPILPLIGRQLHASPSQVELLFTSYNAVMAVAMLITGVVSTRLGSKGTLLTGLAIIVIFSFLAGHAGSIGQIVGFRAGWGLGNAFFIATALAAIVAVGRGGTAQAVILYEAALGLGISVGPLLGGTLGSISWRGPFYGVTALMAIAFIAVAVLLRGVPKPEHRTSVADPIRALRHRSLLTMGVMALLYNFGFFTILAYTPYVLPHLSAHGLGFVFFGWGVLLAVASVFVAPRLQSRFGTLTTTYAMLVLIALDLATIGVFANDQSVVIVAVIICGAFLGINNTLVTTGVMNAAPVERPTASAAYSFVRFIGSAIAPWLAGKLGTLFSPHVPYYVGALGVSLGLVVLILGRNSLRHIYCRADVSPVALVY
ncbi:MFS transporter [Sulfobacillus sp. DSM 109850]|uniref:MFS transporter n=2 Tax=Sulfobacillus harzensis TaxID=2729629 RepID=A0A7Y0Q453_9FIRM|nr:MFS transporter [Sulfobacillus harzensis]NMP22879.1 MFS transporter [Sulfobacillus harzensis]